MRTNQRFFVLTPTTFWLVTLVPLVILMGIGEEQVEQR